MPRGYVLTGTDVVKNGRWSEEDRDPYLLETSVPGVFACGDVRLSPVKRVASAVGEGSMAIAFVHQFLQRQAKRTDGGCPASFSGSRGVSPCPLPALMDVRLDARVIDRGNTLHRVGRQGREVRRPDIVPRLLDALGARDDDAHRLMHEDPAQRELRHARAGRHQRPELFDRRQTDLVGHAGERLADVERFAVAVVGAVVARVESWSRH